MVKVRCQDCGEIQECKKNEIDENSCDCGGSLAILNSDDDTYEPYKCDCCKKEVSEDDIYTCDECSNEVCEDCLNEFENAGVSICKDCLKDIIKTEVKIEYKDKIVEKEVKVYVDKEGNPIDTSFNPQAISKFD